MRARLGLASGLLSCARITDEITIKYMIVLLYSTYITYQRPRRLLMQHRATTKSGEHDPRTTVYNTTALAEPLLDCTRRHKDTDRRSQRDDVPENARTGAPCLLAARVALYAYRRRQFLWRRALVLMANLVPYFFFELGAAFIHPAPMCRPNVAPKCLAEMPYRGVAEI